MTQSSFELRSVAGVGAAATVYVAGEVDATNAGEFTESVAALPGSRPAILDLSRLRYIDSAGFAARWIAC
jgi:anti-sigma B factor antagonist